jgi:hypothetical protein
MGTVAQNGNGCGNGCVKQTVWIIKKESGEF